MNHRSLGTAITGLALGAALVLFNAPTVSARDDGAGRTRCQHRVEKAEEHYRHEDHEHGKHSPQAEEAKARLNSTWDRCWNETHAWYDPDRHEWRSDRDWDRNYDWDRDHDRDRDRDDR